MATNTMLSPYATAALMLASVSLYAGEKGKKMIRARMGRPSVLEISGRRILKSAFLSKVSEQLEGLGWYMLELPDGSFGLLRVDATESWTKVSAKRARDLLANLIAGDIEESDLAEHLDLTEEEEADDE